MMMNGEHVDFFQVCLQTFLGFHETDHVIQQSDLILFEMFETVLLNR